MKKKWLKAQSQIIVVVLLVLLVLAAIVIVWQVVKKTVSESAENVDVDVMQVQLEILEVYIDAPNNIMDVVVSRGSDKAQLSALKFIVIDENNDLIYNFEIYPEPLETKVYTLEEMTLPNVKTISVYPISEKGKPGIAGVYNVPDSQPTNQRHSTGGVGSGGSQPPDSGTGRKDADGDGYYSGSDCNDNDATKWQILTGYSNTDGDDYYNFQSSQVCSGNSLPLEYSAYPGRDCDDMDSMIYPDAGESPDMTGRCSDSKDNDCDGDIDCDDSGCCWDTTLCPEGC